MNSLREQNPPDYITDAVPGDMLRSTSTHVERVVLEHLVHVYLGFEWHLIVSPVQNGYVQGYSVSRENR